MSFLDNIGRGIADYATVGLAEPLYFGPKGKEEKAEQQRQEDIARQAEQERKLAEERERKRQTSLNLLGQMQGPSQSDAQKRRIAALEEESANESAALKGPLSQDADFQADRARLVGGGQEALSGVQNTQAAAGTTGGFSNQGSIQDVYDRLGVGLAQLGQTSRQHHQQRAASARDASADMQQAFVDAQTAYANAQTNAKMAIEQGDADMAAQYLQQAYQARQAVENAYRAQMDMISNRQQATYGAVLGAGATVAGAALGGPAGAAAGKTAAGAVAPTDAGAGGQSGYFNQENPYANDNAPQPTWASLRNR